MTSPFCEEPEAGPGFARGQWGKGDGAVRWAEFMIPKPPPNLFIDGNVVPSALRLVLPAILHPEHREPSQDTRHRSKTQCLCARLGDAAESVGNTIGRDDHGGNIPTGFLAMLEKIEFGVDRYGSAQRPSIHVSPLTGKKLIAALTEQPIEYRLKVETVSEEKAKKAVAREAERISKFRWKQI